MVQLLVKLSEKAEEWGLVELQGQLETRHGVPVDGMHLGYLHFDAKGTPLLIIGHHLLTGKVMDLDKPLAVLSKTTQRSRRSHHQAHEEEVIDQKSGNCSEYEVKALVRRKIIFKNRPKPIITSILPKHV